MLKQVAPLGMVEVVSSIPLEASLSLHACCSSLVKKETVRFRLLAIWY